MPPHRRPNRFPSGTSLLETLLSVFVIAIILTIAGAMLILMLRSYTLYTTRADLVLDASRAADEVTRYANLSYTIEGARTIAGTTYTSGTTTVILRVSSIDSSGDPIANAFDYLVMTESPSGPSQLIEITDPDSSSSRSPVTRLLAEKVQDYHFSYRDASPTSSNDLFFGLTLSTPFRSSVITHTLHTYAKLRNK